jgi:hypothetical protein
LIQLNWRSTVPICQISKEADADETSRESMQKKPQENLLVTQQIPLGNHHAELPTRAVSAAPAFQTGFAEVEALGRYSVSSTGKTDGTIPTLEINLALPVGIDYFDRDDSCSIGAPGRSATLSGSLKTNL